MLFVLASYPVLGAGLKYIDEAFDENRFSKKLAYILAPLLGIFWAYCMVVSPVSASILLAIVLGVLLKGKIDNLAHLAGLGVIFAIIFIAGVQLLYIPLAIFTIAALLDEIGNDYVDKKGYLLSKNIFKKIAGHYFDQRWMTKVAILAVALIGMVPIYFFIAMLFFDGAYLLVRWVSDYRYSKKTREAELPDIC